MNGLLCCAEILGVLLFIPLSGCQTNGLTTDIVTPVTTSFNDSVKTVVTTTTPSDSLTKNPSRSQSVQTTSTTTTPSPTPTPTPSNSPWTFMHLMKHYPMMIIICGVLILVCTILLISTLMLTVKVCQLSRRLRTLGSNGCLVVNAEHWMGMDKRNQAESQPDAKENCFLLADNSATKEDGGKAGEDGQNGEDKKVGEAQESEEAATPATPEVSSPSSKPEEEAASSEPTTAPPPPSSTEDTEKTKNEP